MLPLLLALLAAVVDAHTPFTRMVPNGWQVPGFKAIGHANGKGGGGLTSFGAAFKAADYKWTTELCLADSDGDGETNGSELGDPCCLWSPQELRMMPILDGDILSHPGDANSRSMNILRSNATKERMKFDKDALLAAIQKHAVKGDHLKSLMESAPWHFRCPSFVDDGGSTQGSLGDFMKKFPILTPFGFFCYLYLLAQAKGGVRDFWSATWTWKARAFVFVSAVIYTEVEAALLHLTADNPAFNDLPGFGQLARGFQGHHDDPAGIATLPWLEFLTKIDVGMLLLYIITISGPWLNYESIEGCLSGAGCRRSDSKYLTAFTIVTVPMMYLMMATHRWTHCPPDEVPFMVKILQDAGIFLTVLEHNVHHADYSQNFSLLTGWSNIVFNFVSEIMMTPRNVHWMKLLIIWTFICPFALNWHPSMRPSTDPRSEQAYDALSTEATALVEVDMENCQFEGLNKAADDELGDIFDSDEECLDSITLDQI